MFMTTANQLALTAYIRLRLNRAKGGLIKMVVCSACPLKAELRLKGGGLELLRDTVDCRVRSIICTTGFCISRLNKNQNRG